MNKLSQNNKNRFSYKECKYEIEEAYLKVMCWWTATRILRTSWKTVSYRNWIRKELDKVSFSLSYLMVYNRTCTDWSMIILIVNDEWFYNDIYLIPIRMYWPHLKCKSVVLALEDRVDARQARLLTATVISCQKVLACRSNMTNHNFTRFTF